ncbi:MAG: sigma-70 family RNA polymerase sigma factor [Oscillospiraceae bacterium]|nr:sigma-70 family RNA polymerase sigma factor [Oscillospiraceae bacterium]
MNSEEFTRLVLDAEPTLYHISKSILKNDHDCADAVQEAIIKAFGSLTTLKNPEFFKTWLCRILINECYRICKKSSRTVSYEEYMQGESAPDAVVQNTELYAALMKLTEKERLAVVLHYIEGFKVHEVARILKIPDGTVKSRLSKARAELRIFLSEEEYNLESKPHKCG